MENYNASLVLRKDYKRKDGSQTIYLLVIINKQQKKYTLGSTVKGNHWNDKKRRVTSGDAQYLKKNLELESKLNKANDIFFDHKVKNIPLDIEKFDKLFQTEEKGKTLKNKNSFFDFCFDEIDYDYIELERSYDTYRTRKSTITSIKKFAKKDLPFSVVDYKFIKSLNAYLVKSGKSDSTLARTQKLIRAMFNRAIKQGLVKENPMDAFKIKERGGEREFLHPDELKNLVALYDHPDTPLTWKKALRVFLFCCNTGLRYRDIKNLKFKNIISSVENGSEKHKLRFVMHKSKDWHEVPLNETALRLLPDKTFDEDKVFNVYSNQPMNRYLHDAVAKAKIKKRITFHCSRHTFATILLRRGVAITTVSKLLGHKSLKTTMIYAKVLPESKEEAVTVLDNY